MGQTVKAALQAFMYTSSIAMLEAMALGASAGIAGDMLHDVFRNSAIQSGETGFFRKLVDQCLRARISSIPAARSA